MPHQAPRQLDAVERPSSRRGWKPSSARVEEPSSDVIAKPSFDAAAGPVGLAAGAIAQ